MALDVFLAEVVKCVSKAPNDYSAARSAKAWMQHVLLREDFICSLGEFLIGQLHSNEPGWRLRPLPLPSESPICVRLLVWPPRYANLPHEHRAWTVAGVLLNHLEGKVFDRAPEALDPKVIYSFGGGEGEVGILDPPCIHQLSNPTNAITASLHIFSFAGGTHPDDHHDDDDLQDRYSIGVRERLELALVEILGRSKSVQASHLLNELFECGSPRTKLAICQAGARKQPLETAQRLARLAEFADPSGAMRLRSLSVRIAVGAKSNSTNDG